MYSLPSLEIDDLPMNLDPLGRPQFCRVNDEAFFATFHLGLKMDDDGEWEISSLHMGTQELRGEIYRKFAQYFEADHSDKIHEHCSDNLPFAKYYAGAA